MKCPFFARGFSQCYCALKKGGHPGKKVPGKGAIVDQSFYNRVCLVNAQNCQYNPEADRMARSTHHYQ